MRTRSRALSLEAIEDRSLPSTFVFVDPGFGSHRAQAADTRFVAFPGRGWEARAFESTTFIRIRFGDDSAVFVRQQPTWFQLIPVTVSFNPPASGPQGPVADGETSAAGGSAQSGDAAPVVASHGPVKSTAANAPVNAGEVAVILPAQSSTPAAPATAEQSAASAAAQVAVQNTPPAVAPTTPLLAGYGTGISYATTAIVPAGDAAGPDDVVPPAPATPLDPAPVPDTTDAGRGLVEVAAAAVAPVAGLVPFDFATLQTGAGQFLGRVADLAPSWPDSMPGFTDTLWVAAAALLTGGAAYAAHTRSAARPARDPLAGALSEWERRNGRAAG